jgi:hypothetical protein
MKCIYSSITKDRQVKQIYKHIQSTVFWSVTSCCPVEQLLPFTPASSSFPLDFIFDPEDGGKSLRTFAGLHSVTSQITVVLLAAAVKTQIQYKSILFTHHYSELKRRKER